MKVLVPYDGSEHAAHAVDFAADAFPEESVLLVHVLEPFADHTEAGGYPGHRYEEERVRAESLLEEAAEMFSEGSDVETRIRYGRPAHEIVRIAESETVDQVVLGSHGREGAKRLLLGSVAESVVRRSPAPVTVVRDRDRTAGRPERVLVPFDGSDTAKRALSHALDRYPDAETTVLYVLFPPPGEQGVAAEQVPDMLEDWSGHIEDHADGILDLAVEHARQRDRTVETASVVADPVDGILEFATEDEPDHIVMGSRGRDGIERLLLGSVAETVVRRSPTSVTVVR